MVPWFYVIIAGEVGVFLGFILAASFSLHQMKRFNKKSSFYPSPQERNAQLYKSEVKISGVSTVNKENSHLPG